MTLLVSAMSECYKRLIELYEACEAAPTGCVLIKSDLRLLGLSPCLNKKSKDSIHATIDAHDKVNSANTVLNSKGVFENMGPKRPVNVDSTGCPEFTGPHYYVSSLDLRKKQLVILKSEMTVERLYLANAGPPPTPTGPPGFGAAMKTLWIP